MFSISFGSVISCIFLGCILMLYLAYVSAFLKKHSKHNCNLLIVSMVIIIIRMLFPLNFPFTKNINSTKVMTGIYSFFTEHTIFNISILHLLIIIWALGTCFKLSKLLYTQFKIHKLISSCPQVDVFSLKGIEELDLHDIHNSKIKIVTIPKLMSPCITGLFRPTILLPSLECEPQELKYILGHELQHYYHHDLIIKILSELMICFYWWNPISYFLQQELNHSLELYNDIEVTENYSEEERLNYLQCILNVAKKTLTTTSNTPLCLFKIESCLTRRSNILLNNENSKKSLSYYLNLALVYIILIFSLCFVFEAKYELPKEVQETLIDLEKEYTFFVYNGSNYDVYYHNKFVGTANDIEWFEGYRVYNNLTEAKTYETIIP